MRSAIASRLISFIKNVLYIGSAFFVFTLIFKNIDNRNFLDSHKFDIKKAKDISARLDDVKGIDEIKEEIENLIKMLKEPDRYHSKGANLHKGVLLHGSPGTGKTLLARAIAGEAACSFIYCTGSHFDEMFVGVGAKRIRELFTEAKKHKPCIIFIDEIDTLLSKSRRYNSEHSSSRATINQLLTEMDGFEKTENILIVGATNHEDALDPAAVRPGRFDKKIHVPLPDVKGREDIFEYYIKQINKKDDIQAKKLAQMTPGFSGAEIENLVNTAITEAVHRGKKEADLGDFEYARDRIMMGIERKKLSMSDKERLNTAIHEAGHAIACYFSKGANKLYKATIVARGGSLGATYMVPDDSPSMTKEKILAEIDVAMGGHVAEKLIIGKENITSGCGSDLQGATDLAYRAVRMFGMFGDKAGYISSSPDQTSEKYNAMVDKQVKEILDVSTPFSNHIYSTLSSFSC
jgi:ATP-dependent metalloprotease